MMSSWAGMARWLVMALFFLVPLARGGVQGWVITTMHLTTLVAVAFFFIGRIHRWQWQWIRTPLDLPLAALLVICGLAFFFSQNRWNSGWVFLLCINYAVLCYLMIHLFQTRSQVRQLMGAMIGSAFLVAVIGGLTWWGIHPFGWWRFGDIPHAAHKMSASFGNPNHFAVYMALSLPLALAGGLLVFRSWLKYWCYLVGLLIALGLVLSLSRGGWMAGVCGICALVGWLLGSSQIDHKKLFLGICVIVIAAFLFIFSYTTVVLRLITILQDPIQVLEGRMLVWTTTIAMIVDYPLLGVGPGNFGAVFTQYHPPGMLVRHFFAENDYLQWTAEIGMGVIPIIGWVIVIIVNRALRKRRHNSRFVTGVAAGAFSGLIAIGVHAMVDFPFHIPALALMATGLVALITAPIPVDH